MDAHTYAQFWLDAADAEILALGKALLERGHIIAICTWEPKYGPKTRYYQAAWKHPFPNDQEIYGCQSLTPKDALRSATVMYDRALRTLVWDSSTKPPPWAEPYHLTIAPTAH